MSAVLEQAQLERVSYYGLVDRCVPHRDVIVLYDLNGKEKVFGIYEGYRAVKHEGVGQYRIRQLQQTKGKYVSQRTLLVDVEPFLVEYVCSIDEITLM